MNIQIIVFNGAIDPKGEIFQKIQAHRPDDGLCAMIAENVLVLQTNSNPHKILKDIKNDLGELLVFFFQSPSTGLVTHGVDEKYVADLRKMLGEQYHPIVIEQ